MAFSCRLRATLVQALSFGLIFVALAHVATAEDPIFEKWIGDYQRVYKSSAEKQQRYEVFRTNLQFIESMKNHSGLTYTVGLNEFADLTNAEFLAKHARYTSTRGQKKSTAFKYANLTSTPDSIDWRALGAVTPIKDQGSCGKL
jgi:KDEL-tailed cysteine endopeptidase